MTEINKTFTNKIEEIFLKICNSDEVEEKISDFKSKKEYAKREKDYLEHVIKELENAAIEGDEEETGEEDEK